jgi:hypothetical protein
VAAGARPVPSGVASQCCGPTGRRATPFMSRPPDARPTRRAQECIEARRRRRSTQALSPAGAVAPATGPVRFGASTIARSDGLFYARIGARISGKRAIQSPSATRKHCVVGTWLSSEADRARRSSITRRRDAWPVTGRCPS